METTYQENRAGLKLKFALFYIVSVGLILFVAWLLVPRSTTVGTLSAARPIGDAGAQPTDLMNKIETLNGQYRRLKELDQEFAQQTLGTAGTTANETLQAAETSVNKTLDSVGRIARSLTDQKATLQLQNFIEAYRLALSDRSAMRVYKMAALAPGKTTVNTDVAAQMQKEISARDKRIAELQNENYALQQKTKAVAATTGSTTASQQTIDALKATISDQEKKIANLSTINSALDKQNVANSKELDQAKKATDNGASALKTQNALLEKRVADLTAEVRLAQVDCNLTRADASQIISSSRQRKNLLSDALGTLNNLSVTSDPTIKKKVADKIVRLNQVASTVHD